MSEFWRMCRYFGWNKEDEEQQEAREELKDAMVQQFNEFYGTDIEDINSWQILCGVLGISPIPQELKACRKVRSFCRGTSIESIEMREGGQADARQHCRSG